MPSPQQPPGFFTTPWSVQYLNIGSVVVPSPERPLWLPYPSPKMSPASNGDKMRCQVHLGQYLRDRHSTPDYSSFCSKNHPGPHLPLHNSQSSMEWVRVMVQNCTGCSSFMFLLVPTESSCRPQTFSKYKLLVIELWNSHWQMTAHFVCLA